VTRRDLEIVAKGDPSRNIPPNKVLAEEIKKENRCMAFGIVFSVVASLAAIALAPLIISAIPGLAALAESGAIAHTLIKGAAGLLMYNAVKKPLHALGDKCFHIDSETTADRIKLIGEGVERGQVISQEQILGVYVSSDKRLANYVKLNYGTDYDHLSTAKQNNLVNALNQDLRLDVVAEAINSKRICSTELAFAVQGEASGVRLDEWRAPPKSIVDEMLGKAQDVFRSARESAPPEPEVTSGLLPAHERKREGIIIH